MRRCDHAATISPVLIQKQNAISLIVFGAGPFPTHIAVAIVSIANESAFMTANHLLI